MGMADGEEKSEKEGLQSKREKELDNRGEEGIIQSW